MRGFILPHAPPARCTLRCGRGRARGRVGWWFSGTRQAPPLPMQTPSDGGSGHRLLLAAAGAATSCTRGQCAAGRSGEAVERSDGGHSAGFRACGGQHVQSSSACTRTESVDMAHLHQLLFVVVAGARLVVSPGQDLFEQAFGSALLRPGGADAATLVEPLEAKKQAGQDEHGNNHLRGGCHASRRPAGCRSRDYRAGRAVRHRGRGWVLGRAGAGVRGVGGVRGSGRHG